MVLIFTLLSKGVKMIVSDVDGTLSSSAVPGSGFSADIATVLEEYPFLKRCALSAYETFEPCFGMKHEKERLLTLLRSPFPFKVICTDRSFGGMRQVFSALSPGEAKLLRKLNLVQVRKNGCSLSPRIPYLTAPIHESEVIKPHEEIFEHIREFAWKNGIHPREVVVVDDSARTRFIAKTKYGFRVVPDNTEGIGKEVEAVALQNFWSPQPHLA